MSSFIISIIYIFAFFLGAGLIGDFLARVSEVHEWNKEHKRMNGEK